MSIPITLRNPCITAEASPFSEVIIAPTIEYEIGVSNSLEIDWSQIFNAKEVASFTELCGLHSLSFKLPDPTWYFARRDAQAPEKGLNLNIQDLVFEPRTLEIELVASYDNYPEYTETVLKQSVSVINPLLGVEQQECQCFDAFMPTRARDLILHQEETTSDVVISFSEPECPMADSTEGSCEFPSWRFSIDVEGTDDESLFDMNAESGQLTISVNKLTFAVPRKYSIEVTVENSAADS